MQAQQVVAQDRRFVRMRLLRAIVWMLAMFLAYVLTDFYAPKKAVLVPCVFMALFVPAVLLPMRLKAKE